MKDFSPQIVSITSLKPHPKNYREHPEDELKHIEASIKKHGFYRNIVTAKDLTVLAGHGVWKAAQRLKFKGVPVIRLPFAADDPRALQVLVGDNEIGHLAEQDDRQLAELLKLLKDDSLENLLGTGYDQMMIANLLMVTRPASEIASIDEAAEWIGMPRFDKSGKPLQCIVSFETSKQRAAFFKKLGISFTDKTKSIWFPSKPKEDISSVRFTEKK